MISGFVKKAKELLRDPSRSFKERVFIMLTMLTVILALLALIGDIYFGENIVEIVTLIVTVISAPVITVVSVKLNKVSLAVRLVVIGVIFVVIPVVYFSGGGLYGGGYLWIIFAFLYTGLVLSGVWKIMIMVVLMIESVILYVVGYYQPERVVEHSRQMYFADSLISLLLVGVICCLMVWFEEWLFIEENKRAKEETRKVEELNKAQNRFFSNMSHEIRTPINSILGLNEIILKQEDASEEIIRDSRNIEGAGKMLLSLINDILDMSKIEAGKMDIVPINYNLGDMVSEIANMIWLRAEQKGLELKLEIDPTIPAELFGDEVRVKQILVNILNNAVKYTQEGSVTLRIEKEDSKGDEILLLFSVIDTGMGIKQDVIPHLFDAFQRLDEERNARIEGTGLGLSIVKQLVDLMDGKITVNSIYTEGSTFVVALWQKVTRRDPIGEIDIRKYGSGQNAGENEAMFKAPDARVLIVDDNEMNLEVERKLLVSTQMQIDTALSGEEALSLTAAIRYDIILMDHLMPGMDGIQCLQAVRKQIGGLNNHTPIIVLTANADSESRELYNRSGFDGYLVKPVSGKALEQTVIDHIPEVKYEMTAETNFDKIRMNTARSYARKMPIVVATSSMCDLPKKTLWECQIDIIPFYVSCGSRTYMDLVEASTDEVMRYVANGDMYYSSPPTVEDFERFFGQEIKKAHQVIYITVSSKISEEYAHAIQAAKAYGNVVVIDSEANSSALGMLVLLAYRMASQGRAFEKIVDVLEKVKKDIRCSFVTGDSEFLMRRGNIRKSTFGLISTFGFRPIINIKNGKVTPDGLLLGEPGEYFYKYLDYALPKGARPDLDVAIIDYIDLSDEEMESISAYIRKKFPFEHILFQKVSSVMSLNCGRGAMGLMYLIKRDQPYNLSQVLASVLEPSDDAPEIYDNKEKQSDFVTPETKKAWYENIQGIDPKKAIENSGSEESFKAVLKIFYDYLESREKEISDYYNEENWADYTVKVHALKSSARLVGAMALGDDAEKLEMAGKEGNIDYIKGNTDKLLKDLHSYKDILAPVFEETEKEDAPQDQHFDNIIIDSAYDTLRKAVAKKDERIIDMTLKEIAEYDVPKEHRERLDKITQYFEQRDYDQIEKLLSEVEG